MSIYYIRNGKEEFILHSENEQISIEEIKSNAQLKRVALGTYLSITDDLWNRGLLGYIIENDYPIEEIKRRILSHFSITEIQNDCIDMVKLYIDAMVDLSVNIQKYDNTQKQAEICAVNNMSLFLESCCKPKVFTDDAEDINHMHPIVYLSDYSVDDFYYLLRMIGYTDISCNEYIDIESNNETIDEINTTEELCNIISDRSDITYTKYSCYKIEKVSDLFISAIIEILNSKYHIKKCEYCYQYFVPLHQEKQKYCENEAFQYFYLDEVFAKKADTKTYLTCGKWLKRIRARVPSVGTQEERSEARSIYNKIYKRLSYRKNYPSRKRIDTDKENEIYISFLNENDDYKAAVKAGEKKYEEYILWLKAKDEQTK